MKSQQEHSNHQLFKRFTLAFHDTSLEKAFLEDYREHFLQSMHALISWGVLFFVVTSTVMLIFFPDFTVLPKLCLFVLGLSLAIYLFIRLFPPEAQSIQIIFSIIAVLVGWLYTYLLIALDVNVPNLPVYVVAIHLVGTTFALPLRFTSCITVLFGLWFGFGGIMLYLTELARFDIIWQFLFLGGLSAFCLLSIYQREASTRRNFYQKYIIEKQRQSISQEQEKSESLLLNILPAPIAEQLKERHQVIADTFDETSILFADIVGFTSLAERISAERLVALLNDLFSIFDELADKHQLEKIKTIGDAYMLVSGVPTRRNDHAEAIAEIALEMRREIAAYNTNSDASLQIRVGIHSGSVVAGVIGKKKFAYDLWGDAVNTAARMESHGIPDEIQVTQTTYDLLKNKFTFTDRGAIEVKGKGRMHVYLLREIRSA